METSLAYRFEFIFIELGLNRIGDQGCHFLNQFKEKSFKYLDLSQSVLIQQKTSLARKAVNFWQRFPGATRFIFSYVWINL